MRIGDVVEYMGSRGDKPSGLFGTIVSEYGNKMFIIQTGGNREYLLEEARLRVKKRKGK